MWFKKNSGLKNKKRTSIPYEQNDFDLLCVFPNSLKRFIFLIPIKKLIEKNIIKTDANAGVQQIMCFDKTFNGSNTSIFMWTLNYCFDMEEENVQEKIILFLKNLKDTITKDANV